MAHAVVGTVLAATTGCAPAFHLVDEWHCTEGSAPAHNRVGGGDCFPTGSALPPGYRWDRWGNRPLASSCERDGWVRITNRTDDLTDCVREGTVLPPAWRRAGG